jgi:hypothetical protein
MTYTKIQAFVIAGILFIDPNIEAIIRKEIFPKRTESHLNFQSVMFFNLGHHIFCTTRTVDIRDLIT